jgi:hypothetical protein
MIMLKNKVKYMLLLLVMVLVSCAKRGSITGGLKDTLAPVLKMSFPKNFGTNFKGNEIKLTFDEYIKLKDLKKQLIISPPMKNEPLILPTNVSKYLTIKINDTLQPNTTYSFNFGQSITDNNEGNPYNQFKYVFSTGATIDSLSIGGTVKDAYNKQVEPFVSVMLYSMDAKFKDSVVYSENPRYITNTLDSLKTFKLENLKAGNYLLVAMKDDNSNNKFNPKKDKIGFRKQYITIPNDSTFELKLFKEEIAFKSYKPVQTSGNKLLLPYEGKEKNSKIILKNKTEILPTIITKFPKKDSLEVWFKPMKIDSLSMVVTQDKHKGNFNFKIKELKKDTLNITAVQNGVLSLRDRFTLESATPLTKIDESKIRLVNKNSVSVDFKTDYDVFNKRLHLDFKAVASENYVFMVMPGALNDYMEKTNDTLVYRLETKNIAEYGNLRVNLQNIKHFPVIVDLMDSKGDVIASEYSESNSQIAFDLLDPAVFTLRIVYDDNKNKIWDTGNYLEKRQAEEIVYFSNEIDVRANWDVDQVFDVSVPYTPEQKKKKDTKKKDKSSMGL